MTHKITFTFKLNKQEQGTLKPSKLTRISWNKVMVTVGPKAHHSSFDDD